MVLSASQAGFPLSTIHVTSGGVMGAGLGKRAAVRWGVAGRMATAWLLTLPAAALIAGGFYLVTDALGAEIAGLLTACARRDRRRVRLRSGTARPGHRAGRLMLATIVDWTALGSVVLCSFAAALVLTFLFTSAVLLVEGEAGKSAGARRLAGLVSFALCVAIVAFGLYVMFSSK